MRAHPRKNLAGLDFRVNQMNNKSFRNIRKKNRNHSSTTLGDFFPKEQLKKLKLNGKKESSKKEITEKESSKEK